MDKAHLLPLALLVHHLFVMISHSPVFLDCFVTDPFQIVQGDLFVFWQEEIFDVSRQSDVQVDDSAVHVDEDQVDVEEHDVHGQQESVDESLEDDADDAGVISSVVKIVKFEHVSLALVLSEQVDGKAEQKVEYGGDSIPSDYLAQNGRELLEDFDEEPTRPSQGCED